MPSSPAPSYAAVSAQVDGVDIVRLEGPDGTSVSIAPSLGNNAYEFLVNGQNAFWFPFDSVGAFAARPALCGNPLLAPWANRLDGHHFFANGTRYSLDPGLGNYLLDPDNQPIHGLLLYSAHWEVAQLRAGRDAAQATSVLRFQRQPALMAQFPFAHRLEMTYRLSGTTLEVRLRIRNASAEALPLSVGFHPYFQLPDSPRDAWRVHLPAESVWELNERFTPTGAKLRAAEALPQPADLALRGQFLDHVFGDLQRDSDGWARFWVQGERARLTVAYGEAYPVAVVYAPQGDGQAFLCFEPMSGITNAFNLAHRGIYGELPEIAPGGSWAAAYRITVDGF